MTRDSFIFYGSFFEALSCLEDDTRLKCYDAVVEYALTGNEVELEGVSKAVFALIKPQIDANNERYVNGCKGGRPRTKTIGFEKESNIKTIGFEKHSVSENQTITKQEPNENENVNDNENEKEKKRNFIKPSVDDVKVYCAERNNKVDPYRFVDFYESKGWKVGNQPMKDWKAAVRTWEKRETEKTSPSKTPYKGRTYDFKALEGEFLGNVRQGDL